jgi:hypothetical protein
MKIFAGDNLFIYENSNFFMGSELKVKPINTEDTVV